MLNYEECGRQTMEGNVRYLSEYLRGGTKFIIPVYQRNYDWKKENCKRLMDDLIALETENKETHFFGSIVVKPGDYSQDIIVIDGQQRLTTTSLLMLAMKNWMRDNKIDGERINPSNINDQFLEDSFSRDTDKFKLKSNPRDYVAYKKLFGDEKFYVRNSNITANYDYFYSRLEELPINLDQLLVSIQKLQVMVVNLNSPNDDPQLIFESLNSTGVDLTDADKIRNYLLMNEKQEFQVSYFENYWEPIEERTHFQLSSFFRDYLTVRNKKYPNISKVYETFTTFFVDNGQEKKVFFDELSNYSYAYKQILESSTNNNKINEILKRFNELQVTVIRPFLMAVLHEYNQDRLTDSDVVGIFSIFESYIARRMITKLPSNALNKIIATLFRDMKNIMNKEENRNISVTDCINYLLMSKTNTAKLPTNDEVMESIKVNDFYNTNTAFRTYFFERLENYGHVEALQIFSGIKNQEYSIEHIMPQKLSRQWIQDLGEDYKRVHTTYLNSLGNLTITGYNSKYSNKSFDEKQNMEKGFKQSHFVNLNKIPAKASNWGEEEINTRTDELIEVALKAWLYPETNYVPKSKEREMIIYDGEQHFTNYQIKGYSFINDEYQTIGSWKDFYVNVIKQMADISLNPMIDLSKIENTSGLEGIFSDAPNATNFEIKPGLYVYTALSNWSKMNYLRQLMDIYQISYDALTVDAVLYESKV